MVKLRLTFFTLIVLFVNTVAFSAQPERIAVAGGSITEIIFKLGEQDRIVGVDSTSTFPEEAKNFPILGYVRNISAEGVLSLKPDLLLGEDDTGPTKTLKQVENVGVNTVIIHEDNSLSALKNKITKIAQLLNVEEKGGALLDEIQIDIDALAYANKQLSSSDVKTPRVLFLLTIGNGTPIAAGGETSADTVIKDARGIILLADYKGWKKLSPESALDLNPDVIIVMNRGGDVFDQVSKLSHFKYTTAVKNKAIYTIDGNYLLGFGPRTPQAIVELGTMIYKDFPLPEGYTFRYPHDVSSISGH